MNNKKKNRQFGLSRRSILKYAVPGLLAGIAAPSFFHISSAHAAGAALQGKKTLTVYYSRTGNTQTMAGYIKDMTGSDSVRVETVQPYPTEYRATTRQARKELDSGYEPPLTTTVPNMDEYDVVFVGSPCWWGTICPPMISFLSTYPLEGKVVVPFMTHKGSGLGRTMSHVRELCPGAKVEPGHSIWGNEIDSSQNEVADWLRGLGMA